MYSPQDFFYKSHGCVISDKIGIEHQTQILRRCIMLNSVIKWNTMQLVLLGFKDNLLAHINKLILSRSTFKRLSP